ncbi:MAG: hypothetical protein H6599_05495 [Flavobacteriales bacterium]|nr:hypothetical protein [Flavobacteriales bacterium]
MNTSKGWYNTVLQINNELESRAKSDHKHPLDLLLMEQTNTLIQLFNDCEFVGFSKTDPEAETIVSNALVNVQNSLSDKMDFVPENPFFNLYLGLLYLEKVLQLIKQEYESNLNTTLEHLESIIYNSNDYQNLVEVSRSIGRRIINEQQHPEFGKLKQHIAEQLEYIERTNRTEKTLPPQQTEKPKPEQETPKTFDELFHNIELVQPSIDILKEIEPPLIDTDYNYIGRLKGIICVWIDELQRQGIVKHYSDRKIFASLIPQKIKRFSIDESMFGKYQSKAENNYRTDIKTKVSKIKLSQNSQ